MTVPHVDAATLQPYITRQKSIVETCARAWNVNAIHLTGNYCPADALFVRAGCVVAVVEVKTRPTLTLAGLRGFTDPPGYLVTFDKLVAGRKIARQFGAPYVFVAELVDALVWWLVADANGMWQARLGTAPTTTQATAAGGETTRANAFLALADMRVLVAVND